MGSFKKYWFVLGLLLVSSLAFADMAAVTAAGNAILNAVSLTWTTFFTNVLSAVQGFGGLSWSLKIAVVVMSLIGLLKVSALSTFWDFLGSAQAWLAPGLGLLLGVLLLSANGTLTLSGVFAYMGSGAGALILNELLTGVKDIPGLGSSIVSILNLIQSIIPAPLASKKVLMMQKKKK